MYTIKVGWVVLHLLRMPKRKQPYDTESSNDGSGPESDKSDVELVIQRFQETGASNLPIAKDPAVGVQRYEAKKKIYGGVVQLHFQVPDNLPGGFEAVAKAFGNGRYKYNTPDDRSVTLGFSEAGVKKMLPVKLSVSSVGRMLFLTLTRDKEAKAREVVISLDVTMEEGVEYEPKALKVDQVRTKPSAAPKQAKKPKTSELDKLKAENEDLCTGLYNYALLVESFVRPSVAMSTQTEQASITLSTQTEQVLVKQEKVAVKLECGALEEANATIERLTAEFDRAQSKIEALQQSLADARSDFERAEKDAKDERGYADTYHKDLQDIAARTNKYLQPPAAPVMDGVIDLAGSPDN